LAKPPTPSRRFKTFWWHQTVLKQC